MQRQPWLNDGGAQTVTIADDDVGLSVVSVVDPWVLRMLRIHNNDEYL